jgi:hypothetical protein
MYRVAARPQQEEPRPAGRVQQSRDDTGQCQPLLLRRGRMNEVRPPGRSQACHQTPAIRARGRARHHITSRLQRRRQTGKSPERFCPSAGRQRRGTCVPLPARESGGVGVGRSSAVSERQGPFANRPLHMRGPELAPPSTTQPSPRRHGGLITRAPPRDSGASEILLYAPPPPPPSHHTHAHTHTHTTLLPTTQTHTHTHTCKNTLNAMNSAKQSELERSGSKLQGEGGGATVSAQQA